MIMRLIPILLLLLQDPKWVPSPHFTKGDPATRKIQYVVMHTIEGSLRGCTSWFQNPKSEVSAHYAVGFGGEVVQFVKEEDVAWHAGDRDYNLKSIGIEHEGYADQNLWTLAQYKASAAITRAVCKRYKIPIDREHIISHESITPKRRHDPGKYFDWDLYLSLVKGEEARKPVAADPKKPQERGRIETEDFRKRVESWWDAAEKHREAKRWHLALVGYRRIAFNVEDEDFASRAKKRIDELAADPAIAKAVADEEVRLEIAKWMSFGDTYRDAGMYSTALEHYHRIVDVYPERPEAKTAKERIEEARKK